MKIGMYCGVNAMSYALGQELKKLGHQIYHRSLHYWRGEIEPFEMVICKGKGRDELIAKYENRGADCFVLDWGYIDRVNTPLQHLTGHWQISKNRLNNIPKFDCPPDRLNSLGVVVKKEGGNPYGYDLIIGQMPGDSALNGSNHKKWLERQIASHDRPVYREHPRGGVKFDPKEVDINTGSLDDALAGARMVVTFNSNTGHEALIAGIPVLCDSSAAYHELAGPELPSVNERRAYFSRLAYGQWKVSEASQAVNFILENNDGLD